jgi:rod shape-determining protein MreC
MIFTFRYGWWLLGMVGIAVLLQILAQFGALGPFQNLALTASRPIETVLTGVFRPVADFLEYDEGGLRAENQRLREENADLQRQLTESLIKSARADELEKALDLVGTDTERTFTLANAVGLQRSPGNSVLVIDKGSSDGIERGMVVLSPQQTLIGKVTDVVDDYAYIRLIDDSRSRVNVEIRETGVTGTLEADLRGNLSISFVQANVRSGFDVVTSGLGGNFPAGITVGRVATVSGTAQDLTLDVTVTPAVRLSTVSAVLVVTNFKPNVIAPEDN